jgi:hypothetical protein
MVYYIRIFSFVNTFFDLFQKKIISPPFPSKCTHERGQGTDEIETVRLPLILTRFLKMLRRWGSFMLTICFQCITLSLV